MGRIHFGLGAPVREPVAAHKFFIWNSPDEVDRELGLGLLRTTMNPLIRHWFDTPPHIPVNSFASQHGNLRFYGKDFTGELFIPD
jgi:hypothetical protein